MNLPRKAQDFFEQAKSAGNNVVEKTANVLRKVLKPILITTGVIAILGGGTAVGRNSLTKEQRLALINGNKAASMVYSKLDPEQQNTVINAFLTDEEIAEYEAISNTEGNDGNDEEEENVSETNDYITNGLPEFVLLPSVPLSSSDLAKMLEEYDGQKYEILELGENDGSFGTASPKEFPLQATVKIGSKTFIVYLTTKEENEGGNPPEYETQNFAIDNDRVMPKESASSKLSETCKRVNFFRILREGLTESFKKISQNTNLTDNEKSYMVGRMINASNGTAMNEADKLTPTGKLFLKIYGAEYREALKKGKIMTTIELNYGTGMQTDNKYLDEYIKRVNGNTGEVSPEMEEFEKYQLSQGLFFMITNTDWESTDFTNPENIIDRNKIKSLGETIPVGYTLLLEGGKYGNSWENIVKYAAKINSDPEYEISEIEVSEDEL